MGNGGPETNCSVRAEMPTTGSAATWPRVLQGPAERTSCATHALHLLTLQTAPEAAQRDESTDRQTAVRQNQHNDVMGSPIQTDAGAEGSRGPLGRLCQCWKGRVAASNSVLTSQGHKYNIPLRTFVNKNVSARVPGEALESFASHVCPCGPPATIMWLVRSSAWEAKPPAVRRLALEGKPSVHFAPSRCWATRTFGSGLMTSLPHIQPLSTKMLPSPDLNEEGKNGNGPGVNKPNLFYHGY